MSGHHRLGHDIYRTIEDLEAAKGRVLGPGSGLHIDQSMISAFADTTFDQQWIHVDVERAAREERDTIAHGALTLALVVPLVAQLRTVEVPEAINYGFDRVRFPAPVISGSLVRAQCVIDVVDPTPKGTKVRSEVTLTTANQYAPVCTAQWWTFYPTLTRGWSRND